MVTCCHCTDENTGVGCDDQDFLFAYVSKLVRSVELGRGVSLLRYPPSVAMMFAECLCDTTKRNKFGLWYGISMECKCRSTSKLAVGVLRWISVEAVSMVAAGACVGLFGGASVYWR